jgi:hypothetical protein
MIIDGGDQHISRRESRVTTSTFHPARAIAARRSRNAAGLAAPGTNTRQAAPPWQIFASRPRHSAS